MSYQLMRYAAVADEMECVEHMLLVQVGPSVQLSLQIFISDDIELAFRSCKDVCSVFEIRVHHISELFLYHRILYVRTDEV